MGALFAGLLSVLASQVVAAQQAGRATLDVPVLVVRVPASSPDGDLPAPASTPLTLLGDRGVLIELRPNGTQRVLSEGFHSAADVSLSFDGRRCLFAGKRTAQEPWNIFELSFEDGQIRQLTRDFGQCRQPSYQSNLFTVDSPAPWSQVTFVSDAGGCLRESASGLATSLYSCRLDGTQIRRLSYNLSDDADPFLMGDGRILYASWQRATLERGPLGRSALFAVNIEGTDNALFAETAGLRFKRMPCVTDRGVVLFVENEEMVLDGGGQVGSVSFRRPLHSYRPITSIDGGFAYRAPAPCTQGRVLICRRRLSATSGWGLYVMDPRTGDCESVLDDPAWDEIQAIAVRTQRPPDGRSTVVDDSVPLAKLYCLNVYQHDLPSADWLSTGTAVRVRLLEGVPECRSGAVLEGSEPAESPRSEDDPLLPSLVPRRLLGESEVEADGSFHISIPANIPIELQLLDQQGMALRTCGWIWSKNVEARGCIGCHEDGESTPHNSFTDALRRPAVALTLPPERRRTVDFRRDIMPIVEQKCVSCHGPDGAPPRLDGGVAPVPGRPYNQAYASLLAFANLQEAEHGIGLYVHRGSARTSPLLWHLLGKNTSRPWDCEEICRQTPKPIPTSDVPALTNLEIRLFVEWVDLGALWDGIPGPDESSGP